MIAVGDVQGHWRRDWLTTPDMADHDTAVHWLQAGPLYVDLRIPAGRPATAGGRALADLPDRTLIALMRSEGFAGTITVTQGICTWAREINWHGRPAGIDAGHIAFDGRRDRLMETGVHGDYLERWHRISEAPGRSGMFHAGDRTAFLVTVGAQFAFGVGRPGAAPSCDTLRALDSGSRGDGLARHFESLFAIGTWDGDLGRATLATDPFVEGRLLLTRMTDGQVTWSETTFDGTRRDIVLTPAAIPAA